MQNLIAGYPFKVVITSALFGLILTFTLAFKAFKEKPVCAIMLLKQNVLYIGVDNPVSIIVSGVAAEKVVVHAQGMTIQKKEGNNYVVNPSLNGEVLITVMGGDMEPTTFPFQARRVPDPHLLLGAQHLSGSIEKGRFVIEAGVAAVLTNFNFEAKCEVIGYGVTYLAKRQDPVTVVNSGARFNDQALELVSKAKPGDTYIFDELRVRCTGDGNINRSLGSMVFRIR